MAAAYPEGPDPMIRHLTCSGVALIGGAKIASLFGYRSIAVTARRSGGAHHRIQPCAPAGPHAQASLDVAHHVRRGAEEIALGGDVVAERIVEAVLVDAHGNELHHHRIPTLEIAALLVDVVLGLAVRHRAPVEVE